MGEGDFAEAWPLRPRYMATVTLKNVKKIYDNKVTAVHDFNLEIADKEFIVLVGPSGCGKSTTLRMVAGLEEISEGDLFIGEKRMNDVEPKDRDIAMVFQSYALYPHMTVYENMAFALKLRKLPKEEIDKKVREAAEILDITSYLDRKPKALSGGQRQRVAIGRAIVRNPQVFLMDEPLSNLDAKLRIEMRSAIRDVQKQVGITTVYVTHDQEEALAISDRIAVMKSGVIQQVGRPENIYTRPANVFVSTFIGHSNLFRGKIVRSGTAGAGGAASAGGAADGCAKVVLADGYEIGMDNIREDAADGQSVIVSVRPEEFSINPGVEAKIKTKTFLGKYVNYTLEFPEEMIVPGQPSIEYSQDIGHADHVYQEGERIALRPNPRKINVFTEDGSESLIKDVMPYE